MTRPAERLSPVCSMYGYPVLMAENGQKAFEVLNKTSLSPCVVLLDLRMPVMDGRAFLERRATDTELRRIPVSRNVWKPALERTSSRTLHLSAKAISY